MGMNFKNNCLLVNNFKNIVDYYKNKNEQFRLFCIVLYDNELHSEFYEYMMKNFSKFHTSTGKHLLFISTSEESKENSTYEETKINKYVLKNILKHLMINISLEELPIIIFNEGLHQGRFYYKKVNSSNIEDTFEKLTKISEVLWEKDKENYELPRFKGSLFTKLFKDTKFKEIEVVNNKVNGKYISLEEIFLNAIAPSLLINNLDDEEIKKEVKFQFEDIQKRTTNIDKITSYENILLLNILEEMKSIIYNLSNEENSLDKKINDLKNYYDLELDKNYEELEDFISQIIYSRKEKLDLEKMQILKYFKNIKLTKESEQLLETFNLLNLFYDDKKLKDILEIDYSAVLNSIGKILESELINCYYRYIKKFIIADLDLEFNRKKLNTIDYSPCNGIGQYNDFNNFLINKLEEKEKQNKLMNLKENVEFFSGFSRYRNEAAHERFVSKEKYDEACKYFLDNNKSSIYFIEMHNKCCIEI